MQLRILGRFYFFNSLGPTQGTLFLASRILGSLSEMTFRIDGITSFPSVVCVGDCVFSVRVRESGHMPVHLADTSQIASQATSQLLYFSIP